MLIITVEQFLPTLKPIDWTKICAYAQDLNVPPVELRGDRFRSTDSVGQGPEWVVAYSPAGRLHILPHWKTMPTHTQFLLLQPQNLYIKYGCLDHYTKSISWGAICFCCPCLALG